MGWVDKGGSSSFSARRIIIHWDTAGEIFIGFHAKDLEWVGLTRARYSSIFTQRYLNGLGAEGEIFIGFHATEFEFLGWK